MSRTKEQELQTVVSSSDDSRSQTTGSSSPESSVPLFIDPTNPSEKDEMLAKNEGIEPQLALAKSNRRTAQCTCWFTVFLLCFINALNYVNRYTLPPVVSRLKISFDLSDMQLGLIQTCFELVYVVSSPIFGYLGDRLNRTYILTISLLIANTSGLACSFVPENSFIALFVTRAILGMGEAAFSNIGPVVIADMFVGKTRTLVIAFFQFAIPIGCGLGYIIASLVADYTDDWRWAFRLTPGPIAVGIILWLIFVREPKRGEAENAVGLRKTSFLNDIASILKSPSFTLTTLAFIGVAFSTGGLCYWTPYLISRMYAIMAIGAENSEAEIGLIFGVITILSGMAGVIGGAVASNNFLKPKCGPAADGIVCGAGMLIAAPFIYSSLIAIQFNMMLVCWITIFFGIAGLCCCWVLLSEITMNVVVPTRRATAAAFMSAVSHLFGDALSPYLIGLISDQLRKVITKNDPPGSINLFADFISMQSSLFLSPLLIIIAGGIFLAGSLFINEDTEKAKEMSHRRDFADSNAVEEQTNKTSL